MKILICLVTSSSRVVPSEALAKLYLDRIEPYAAVEVVSFRDERALFQHLGKLHARTSPVVVMLDSRGKAKTSEEFAAWLGGQRDAGQQQIVFAIGPANGWSAEARSQTSMLLSFGPMTLPHELMRPVLAEQIYRAFTILAGHPYHLGHSG